jgi:hypothetical protein
MVRDNIVIEGARIGFRNFSGKEGKFNPAGKRNFCVFLNRDLADRLIEDGWNVRELSPRSEDDNSQPYLQVAVSFENIPPKVVLITSQGKTYLDEESVGLLDWAEIQFVDLIIRPYNWVVQEGTKNEKSGVKAYVKSMYIEIVEDQFEKKWANSPTVGVDGGEELDGD